MCGTSCKGILSLTLCYFSAGMTECQKQRFVHLSWTTDRAKGRFMPECREDGSFKRRQCEPDNEYCWCVDDEGNPVPRTYTKGLPRCEEPGLFATEEGWGTRTD